MIENRTSDEADEAIAAMAGEAFHQAMVRTLDAGISVLVVKKGSLVRVHPDGREEFVKKIARPQRPGIKVTKGIRTAIKWSQTPD